MVCSTHQGSDKDYFFFFQLIHAHTLHTCRWLILTERQFSPGKCVQWYWSNYHSYCWHKPCCLRAFEMGLKFSLKSCHGRGDSNLERPHAHELSPVLQLSENKYRHNQLFCIVPTIYLCRLIVEVYCQQVGSIWPREAEDSSHRACGSSSCMLSTSTGRLIEIGNSNVPKGLPGATPFELNLWTHNPWNDPAQCICSTGKEVCSMGKT